MPDSDNSLLSLRQYYGRVWIKAKQLEKRSWLKHAFGEIVPVTVGTLLLAWLFGFAGVLEARRYDLALLGIGLIVFGIRRFVACLVRAPHVVHLEGQSALLAARTERDTAIAAQRKRIDKQEAYGKLTALIKVGSEVRQKIEAAVNNSSNYVTTIRGMSPVEDAESQLNIWRVLAEKTAEEHFPGLYPRLLAISHAARLCD
jgi:hypothetical protein